MRAVRRTWKLSLLLTMVWVCMTCLPVMASGLSDDNSLSSLGVHNGTVEPEFEYSTWEYNVTVEPGTEELLLEPVTSDSNATITSITGTVLEDGKATVMINLTSESGIAMTYTLHVTESGAASESETDQTESATQTESETQMQTTEQTEPTQPETQDNSITLLQSQVDELKSNNDLLMKIIYGLIAFAVILLILIINLILKNHDLKKDVKEAEDRMAHQMNEFARKEKSLATDNYYEPSRQKSASEVVGKPQALEETFGASPEPEQQENSSEPLPEAADADKKKDVDVTMVEL